MPRIARLVTRPSLLGVASRPAVLGVRSHCQVPCGIFDDPARVAALKEDAATVRKAMVQINELGTAAPLALNQVTAAFSRPVGHGSPPPYPPSSRGGFSYSV